jgi:sulfur carrier protein
MTVTITVNGETRDLPPGVTLADVVGQLTASPKGVAAALNGEVVPRRAWSATALAERDEVEVVTAVQGG